MAEEMNQNQDDIKNLPDGFRMTELGPLPEEWRVVRLGEVCEVVMGQSPPSSTYNSNGLGLPFFQGKADFGELYPIPRVWCTKPKKVAETGDVLISVRAPVGPTNIANIKSCIGRGLAALRASRNLHREWLLYYLRSIENGMKRSGSGSTFNAITKRELIALSIPLPPLSEQRAIARVLRAVQQAKEATDRVIQATQELKKSLMRHLFTYGPVPPGESERVPLKETEIGMMPEEWRVVRLGEVTKKSFGGGTPSTKKPEYWDGLLPWITTAIINPQDVYLTRYQRRITEDGLKHSSTKKACKGCLLVGTRVGVGKAVVTTFDVAINQDLTAIELDIDTIQPEYVSLYFKTRLVQQWFASNKRGARGRM